MLRTQSTAMDDQTVAILQLEGADPSNPMDRLLAMHLLAINREMPSALTVRRVATGKYEVDGRRVSLRWGGVPGAGGIGAELLVREDEVGDSAVAAGMEMPLAAYLLQAYNVAASLRGRIPGAPVVARIPKDRRLSFNSPGSNVLEDIDWSERSASMRLACEEARLREQAAERLSSSWSMGW